MKRNPISPFLPPDLARALDLSEVGGGRLLPLEALSPVPSPGAALEEASLKALAESVRAHGVLEPLLVRPLGEGEVRDRGRGEALPGGPDGGASEVPVVVLEGLDEKAAAAIALMENLQREDLNPYEETVGSWTSWAWSWARAGRRWSAFFTGCKRRHRGKAAQNVLGRPEAKKVEEVFPLPGAHGVGELRPSPPPLLNLPPDLQEALLEGAIPYTAALELKKVKEESLRLRLLEEARAGLSLRDLKAKVRELLRKDTSPPPWHKEVLARLAKVDLEALPAEKRAKVEEKLREIGEILGD